MKKIALFSLLAATAMMLTPKPAAASDKGLAILDGVLGGMIIANSLNNDSHHHTTVEVGYRHGYWRTSTYDVWINGRWVIGHNGRRCYVPGHYETRVRKVWVSGPRRHHHHDHRRHDRYAKRDHRHHDRNDGRHHSRHDRGRDYDRRH